MARRGRITIGLYNSYDTTRFAEAHRRALARAGTVAWAFDANLVTFGFPFRLLAERVGESFDASRGSLIAEWVAKTTTIGSEGTHFVALAQQGRFHLEETPRRGFPPQYGIPVLTTSRVPPEENTSAAGLVDLLERGQSILLVFGLGPHGVPRRIEQQCTHRFDLTDRNISLETCTALGAAPAILHSLLNARTRTAPNEP